MTYSKMFHLLFTGIFYAVGLHAAGTSSPPLIPLAADSGLCITLVGTLASSVIGAAAADKSGAAAPTVTVYPAPEGAPVSSNYVLTVDGRTVPVYSVPTRNACFASCDIAGSVTVTAMVNVLPPQKISTVSAHPLSRGIAVQRDGNVCTFRVDRPGSVTLLINGEYGGCPLHIFFNPPAEAPPKDAIVFGPGKHVLGYEKPITLTNGQSVYLAGGAWVEGIIRATDASNIRILGRGVLCQNVVQGKDYNGAPAAPPGICLVNCQNVTLEGIIETRSVIGWCSLVVNCERMTVRGYNVITPMGWSTDGFNPCNSRDITIERCFFRTGDDCISIKGATGPDLFKEPHAPPAEQPPVENIVVSNCVFWGEGNNVIAIGSETRARYMRNIRVQNCDVLYHKRDSEAVFAIIPLHSTEIRDIVYDDIRIEHCISQLFNFRFLDSIFGIPGDQSYPGAISNVTIRNISVGHQENGPRSTVFGYSEAKQIQHVTIQDLRYDGKLIHNVAEGGFALNKYTPVDNIRFITAAAMAADLQAGGTSSLPPIPSAADSGLCITLEGTGPSSVARYARYEIGFQLNRTYDNPFDPQLIDVQAIFVSPSGKRVRVPGFFFQDYPEQTVREDKKFQGTPGPAGWKVRFTPTETGSYQGRIVAVDTAGRTEIELPPFVVTPSDNPGFIHAVKGPWGRTVFDNGRMFLPIGECLWVPQTLAQFEQEFDQYSQHGMNYFRFFTTHDSMFFFESKSRPAGQYDLFILRKLDVLFDLLAARDLYAMPCLEMFADFRITQPYPYWDDNAYNQKNGGPCKNVSDFFVDPEARRLYRNRLRYFMARYGYSPNLFCLQLFAEVNYIEQYQIEPVRQWHQEMAAYIHSIDPYGHPVSTSMAAWNAQDQALFALPEIDLVLNEIYNVRDFAGKLAQDNRDIMAKYKKPAFLAEMGIAFEYFGVTDPSGVHIHNAIWANPLSGGIGVPSFWWTSYIRQKELLPHFKAFAEFIKGEDFCGLQPVDARLISGSQSTIHPDLIIPYPFIDPPGSAGPQTITLPNDQFIEQELPNMPHVFYPRTTSAGLPGPNYNPITFLTDFAADGALTIFPPWVEGSAADEVRLQVIIDGQLAKEIRFNGCPMNDWDKFLKHSQATCVPTTVDVPKGRHRIVLDNQGTLCLSAAVDFRNYLSCELVNLRVLGLGDGSRAYLWIQNRDNTWWRHCLGQPSRTIRGASVLLPDMSKGEYEIEWWDTIQGRCVKRDRLDTREGVLTLKLPDMETDIACKIKRFTKRD